MTGELGRVAVVGYASLDSSTSVAAFRGLDATSILDRPMVADSPGFGGIAHLARAVAATGTPTEAVSWVGADRGGTLWREDLMAGGTGTSGVAVSGSRSPSATLIEVATGGTICLFDPGDGHNDELTEAQREILATSEWILLTVAPRHITAQLLQTLRSGARLAWAVKHDDDAYTPAMVRTILERADVVSFSRGERSYVTVDGVDPERLVRPDTLVVETRGTDGVAWSFASGDGPIRRASLPVTPIQTTDSTGAGDTFVGALVGRIASVGASAQLTDPTVTEFIAYASNAAAELLLSRVNPGRTVGRLQKENH